MALLKFLKGNYTSLSTKAISEGQILICGDTGEMFVDVAADKRVKIGDFVVVANITALEALDASAVPTSRLYYVEDGNILARSNGTSWIQINKQKTLAELGGVSLDVYNTKMTALDKADTDNAAAIAGVDTRLQAAEEKLKSVATTEGLGELTRAVEGNTAKIDTIMGDADTTGSMLQIAKAAADGKDAAIKEAKDAADAAQADVDELAQTHAADKKDLDDAIALKADADDVYTKGEIDGKVDAINDVIDDKADAEDVYTKEEIDEMISALEDADDVIHGIIGDVDGDKTIVDMIADAQAAATYDDEEVRGLIDANTDAIEKEVSDREDAVAGLKSELEGKINAKVEQSAYNEKVAALEGEDEKLAGLIGDNTEAIEGVVARVDTLVGEDANKSVRTIANEELAKQLIPENAAEAMNELQEIAAWIQAHPGDAATMNAAITALQNKVDTGDVTVSAYVTAAINALKIGDYATVAALNEAVGRIAALETASATHATKDELKAVSDELDNYKTTHADDYTNAQVDAKVKTVQDQIDALGDTYATDDELEAAVEAEVDRADAAYAAKTLESTVDNHVADEVAHITADERTAWNGAQAAAEATAAAALSAAREEITEEIATAKDEAVADAKAETESQVAVEAARADAAEKANAKAIADEKTAREQADVGLQAAIDTINDETNGILAQAKADATSKANTAESNAKSYIEGLFTWGEF